MPTLQYTAFEDGDIYVLKDLCNSLMRFQADHATIKPQVMASMNFENRLVPDFNNSEQRFIVIAYDNKKPIGFAFANISCVSDSDTQAKPAWAEDLEGNGFYPQGYTLPKTIGTFKLLYVSPEYRGHHVGAELSTRVMKWFEGHKDIDDLWVFVANGNEVVGGFYEKLGYSHSHTVYSGFIEAYRK